MSVVLNGECRYERMRRREKQFVREYKKDLNGSAAIVRMGGYSEKLAYVYANRFKRRPYVKKAIEKHLKRLEEQNIKPKRVNRWPATQCDAKQGNHLAMA